MQKIARLFALGCVFLSSLSSVSCGGGGGGSTIASSSGTGSVAAASNVVPVIVDAGPSGSSVNSLFTTITLCVPGSTTQCQTIDHIQVDTGSYGVRILASVLTLTLPTTMASDGNSLVECTQFVDGYSWGPISSADVEISGETAASVPIQVIGASTFPSVPAACSGIGPAEDTVAAFGANGILGIGVFEQDCGSGCASSSQYGFYYSCTATACSGIAAPLSSQVLNPVPLFATDNNGSIVDLPTVAASGAASVTGSLIFGIDTQTNNVSGTETVLNVQTGSTSSQQLPGNITIAVNGQTLVNSFIDSGSNGIFFNDSSLTACTDTNFSGFYCPASTQNFTATLTGVNNASTTATFSVGNAQTLTTNSPIFTAFPTLAGTYSTSTDSFDWGLPFYYGRRVATAIETHTTSVGTGPYMAF
ncbi:MAG TPA: DUF3443 domain-containing protein [Steroidobacteraceae bacterium]|nr:DUF3443 domain-containing protein [Steroidobacteraceae bacterium]